MSSADQKRLLVAITGASGSLYARVLLEQLAGRLPVDGVISDAGRQVLAMETGLAPEDLPGVDRWFAAGDFTAPPASGSAPYRGMVVIPCTMGTLAAISGGLSRNLIHRAADVMLKERRPLLLAVRETPFNRTHLENMLRVHDAGATIFPAMPAFYHRPADLEAMAAHFTARILSHLAIEVASSYRWSGGVSHENK